MKTICLIINCILAIAITGCSAQTKNLGSLSGNLRDSKENEPLIEATLILSEGDSEFKKVKSDFDGNYKLDSIPSGKYNLKVLYIGFTPIEIKDAVIKANETSTLNLSFNQALDLKDVKVEWSEGYVSFIDSTGNFRCVKSEKK